MLNANYFSQIEKKSASLDSCMNDILVNVRHVLLVGAMVNTFAFNLALLLISNAVRYHFFFHLVAFSSLRYFENVNKGFYLGFYLSTIEFKITAPPIRMV